MRAPALPLVLQAALVEEAVLRAISGRPEERSFRRARDQLYLLPEGDEREHAFERLHEEWFARLVLGAPIHAALGELPLLAEHCAQCVVTRAATRADEGADLLVAPDRPGRQGRTVVVRLRASAFAAPEALLMQLRAELLHVADIVDPAFGYEPVLPAGDGDPAYAQLVRDRYRALWDATIAGRLARRRAAGPEVLDAASRAFAAAFPMLGSETVGTCARFFGDSPHTHAELAAFAALPRGTSESPALVAGARCPLCRFPTYAPEPAPADLPVEVLGAIAIDFPEWQAHQGLCRQCGDLYRARPLAIAAASQFPG